MNLLLPLYSRFPLSRLQALYLKVKPLLLPKLRRWLPPGIRLMDQGTVVANSLADYLARHPEMAMRLTRNGHRRFFTTEMADTFNERAGYFLGRPLAAEHLEILAAPASHG